MMSILESGLATTIRAGTFKRSSRGSSDWKSVLFFRRNLKPPGNILMAVNRSQKMEEEEGWSLAMSDETREVEGRTYISTVYHARKISSPPQSTAE